MQNMSQDVRDALADAAQLDLAWRYLYNTIGSPEAEVENHGWLAAEYLDDVSAERAAHAAFQAVPGLRGGCDCDRCECERLTDRGDWHTACPSCNSW